MLKPLIRTIPNISGNVKIACSLSNFEQVGEDFECVVRYARLIPISNVLADKQYEVNLLNSTYEFDLQKFYKMYSSIFYDTTFEYSKNVYGDVDFSRELQNRDKDFEFGLKRVSATKNGGAQFSFFAPIWIDNPNDLPDYFMLHVNIDKYANNATKTIKIKINDKQKSDKHNYLSTYLNKYAKNINTNVVFCTPLTNQATYHGIDLERGGFVKKVDNIIGKNYKYQSSINKFDLNITEGFRRNKICIKQVLPLCFLFSLEDILSDYEVSKYGSAKINVTGEYWKDNAKVPMHSFSTDYTNLRQKSWLVRDNKFMNMDTGLNIMDMPFPSLMEASYHGYEHFNKLQKESVRWKLKYSSDDYPYITNMSPAFSIAQESSFKYREYPTPFTRTSVYDNNENNILSPLVDNEFYSKEPRMMRMYKAAMQNNASTWFSVIDDVEWYTPITVHTIDDLEATALYKKYDAEEAASMIPIVYNGNTSNADESMFENATSDNSFTGSLYVKCDEEEIEEMAGKIENEHASFPLYRKSTIFDKKEYWADAIDNKVYFKGILYDFSKIYEKYPELNKINKFGVFVMPSIEPVAEDMLNEIKSAKVAILSDRKYTKTLNAVKSTLLRKMLSGQSDYSQVFMSEESIGKRMDEATDDSLFFENTSPTTDGQFLDLTKIGYDVYELNKYYELKEVLRLHPELEELISFNREKHVIQGYCFIPIYRLSQVVYDNKALWFESFKNDNDTWIKSALHYNLRTNYNKIKYEKNAFANVITKYAGDMLECPLYIETEFISASSIKELFGANTADTLSNECKHYMFNPTMVDQNETYAMNMFSETRPFDMNYGDYLPEDKTSVDLDFIYVDPFNMANVMGDKWDNCWLTGVYSNIMNAKFLNDTHLKIYIGELHKDEKHEFVANTEYKDKLDKMFVKRRILFNDSINEQLQLKDLYVNILDFYRGDYDELTNEAYRDICRRVLIDLIHDEKTGTWHFSDDFANSHDIRAAFKYTDEDPLFTQCNFELVFRKNFLKVNSLIWEKIAINSVDKFVDLYLYRASKEDDYPSSLKYVVTSNMDLFDETTDTNVSLQPLFTHVFMKNQKASTIYSEYNQSKISYAQYGDEKFYRYDSDNTPLVLDISDIDIEHNLIYGKGGVAYYSHAYLNNLANSYDPYNTQDLAFDYMNKQGQFANFSENSYLPTLVMIDNCEAKVTLAHGTEPVKEYYSASSYNYYAHNTTTSTRYFSQYEYDRMVDDDYNGFENLHLNFGQHTQTVDQDVTIHAYEQSVNEDTVKTYYDIHSRYAQQNIDFNDLGIYDEFGISTYTMTYTYNSYYSYVTPVIKQVTTKDGLIAYNAIMYKSNVGYTQHVGYCTYGMVCIDATLDNTNSSVNLIDKWHNDKKYFTKVNGRDIYSEGFSFKDDFVQFVPFIKFDLANALSTYDFKVTPYVGIINAFNYPVKIEGRNAYDIVRSNKPMCQITLERYFDAITPLITEVTDNNTYMLKLDKKDKHVLVKAENDESVLYNENLNLNSSNGTRVYSNKNDYERVFQIEEKHFNDNYTVNLESTITIPVGKHLTYEEVLENEKEENVIKMFADYIRRNGEFDDNEILFLYNKYKVNYDSYSTGIDYSKVCKVYSLTIIFKLL